jgi:integrase
MYPATSTGKAAKGSVQVIVSNDRLQLRFRFGGKRHYLSLGFPDSKATRKLAEQKAREIELDILSGNFDPSLAKYRPENGLAAPEPAAAIPAPKISLLELWEKYTEYRKPQIAETTLRIQYRTVASHISKLPAPFLDEAIAARNFFLKTLSTDTTRRTITQISACCDWAIESGLISTNPFKGMAEKIKVIKPQRMGHFDDIDPFTAEERDAIYRSI